MEPDLVVTVTLRVWSLLSLYFLGSQAPTNSGFPSSARFISKAGPPESIKASTLGSDPGGAKTRALTWVDLAIEVKAEAILDP